MFGITNYYVFIFMGIILNMTPGPDTMYIIAHSISQGKKAGLLSMLGISSGSIVHTLLAALGLSIILLKSALVFSIIKYIGVMYLIYIGIISIIKKSDSSNVNDVKSNKYGKIYLKGFFTNITNPKVALFYISFLPQFIDKQNNYGIIPFLILGITFVITGSIWCFGVVMFSSSLTKSIRKNNRISNILNKLSGVLYIVLGLKLLTAKQK